MNETNNKIKKLISAKQHKQALQLNLFPRYSPLTCGYRPRCKVRTVQHRSVNRVKNRVYLEQVTILRVSTTFTAG